MKNVREFMKQINFPDEAVDFLASFYEEIKKNEPLFTKFNALCEEYMKDEDDTNDTVTDSLSLLAEEHNVNEYSLTMMLLVVCGQKLEILYAEKNLPEEVFKKTIDDLRCKLIECHDCYGVWGTFVGGWFHSFYVLKRFGVGRFQFDLNELRDEYIMPNGEKFPEGIKMLGMHIPSSGIPLTDEVRYDSYKKAYDFFKDRLYNGKLLIECGSWLLYDRHKEFLPEKSNILKFMGDFDIVSKNEKKGFGDIWRIFAGYQDLPYDRLPEDNSLRKAYKKHLIESNGWSGSGYGYIVFDGEKIVNR